jgi:hypothetical protein
LAFPKGHDVTFSITVVTLAEVAKSLMAKVLAFSYTIFHNRFSEILYFLIVLKKRATLTGKVITLLMYFNKY